MAPRFPTQQAVADRAGVSQAAVSKVLGSGGVSIRVSPETRQRILSAAQELGYRPARAGPAVETGRPPRIRLCSVDPADQDGPRKMRSRYLAGIAEQATALGYDLLIPAQAFLRDRTTELESQGPVDPLADSTILLGDFVCQAPAGDLAALLERRHPLVCLGHRTPLPGAVSQFLAVHSIEVVVLALLGLNHRKILYVGADEPLQTGLDREQAFCRSMTEHQLTPRVQRPKRISLDLKQILQQQDMTCLLFECDALALAWQRVSKDSYLQVPRDYSFASLGPPDEQCSVTPDWATPRHPTAAMGLEAVSLLDRLLSGGAPEVRCLEYIWSAGTTTRQMNPF